MATYGLRVLERRIRSLTRDTRFGDYAADPDMVMFALDRALAAVYQKLSAPPQLVTTLLTTAVGDFDYTLGAAYNDAAVLTGFRLTSTGAPIVRKDLPTWQDFRRGNPSATGDPVIIAFSEGIAGAETAYLWPTPTTVDTVSAIVAVGYSPNDPSFNANGRGPYDSDIFGFELPGESVRAVELHAASRLLAAMSPETIARLGLDPNVAKLYDADYQDVLREELKRERRLRRDGEVLVRNAF